MDRIDRIADRIVSDWVVRAPHANLAGVFAPSDLEDAYRIQSAVQRRHAKHRGPVAGRKIALSSPAMQEMVGIDRPIAGAFFAEDVQESPAVVPASEFRHLGIECELAFVLGTDIEPDEPMPQATGLMDVISAVHPAFELIEDRDADYADLDVFSLVADNAWCGGVVLGTPIADWRDRDLADLPAVLKQEGHSPEAVNTGAADPWGSLAWLLKHCQSSGIRLRAGEILITGSAARTRFPLAGERVVYEIAGAASVEMHLV